MKKKTRSVFSKEDFVKYLQTKFKSYGIQVSLGILRFLVDEIFKASFDVTLMAGKFRTPIGSLTIRRSKERPAINRFTGEETIMPEYYTLKLRTSNYVREKLKENREFLKQKMAEWEQDVEYIKSTEDSENDNENNKMLDSVNLDEIEKKEMEL
jgi:nucleoid DNA-binding protein